MDADCEVTSAWLAVGRQSLGGLESHYKASLLKMKDLGRSGKSGTRDMGDLGEGRGVCPTEMKDFIEETRVQVIFMPL